MNLLEEDLPKDFNFDHNQSGEAYRYFLESVFFLLSKNQFIMNLNKNAKLSVFSDLESWLLARPWRQLLL